VCLARTAALNAFFGDESRCRAALDQALGRFMHDGNWRGQMVMLCELAGCALRREAPASELVRGMADPAAAEDSSLFGQLSAPASRHNLDDADDLFDRALDLSARHREDFAALAMCRLKSAEVRLGAGTRQLGHALKDIDAARQALTEDAERDSLAADDEAPIRLSPQRLGAIVLGAHAGLLRAEVLRRLGRYEEAFHELDAANDSAVTRGDEVLQSMARRLRVALAATQVAAFRPRELGMPD
jgi:tetratricopeptide (TPR) repeat protein